MHNQKASDAIKKKDRVRQAKDVVVCLEGEGKSERMFALLRQHKVRAHRTSDMDEASWLGSPRWSFRREFLISPAGLKGTKISPELPDSCVRHGPVHLSSTGVPPMDVSIIHASPPTSCHRSLVTVKRACELSSLGPSTVWTFIRDGRLQVVRVPGVRRHSITYIARSRDCSHRPRRRAPRRRGRPRKVEVNEATA